MGRNHNSGCQPFQVPTEKKKVVKGRGVIEKEERLGMHRGGDSPGKGRGTFGDGLEREREGVWPCPYIR